MIFDWNYLCFEKNNTLKLKRLPRDLIYMHITNSNSTTFPSSPCISTMMISEAVQAAKFNQFNPVWSDEGTLAWTMAIHRHSMHESFLGLKGPSEDSGRTPKAARQLNRATREAFSLWFRYLACFFTALGWNFSDGRKAASMCLGTSVTSNLFHFVPASNTLKHMDLKQSMTVPKSQPS